MEEGVPCPVGDAPRLVDSEEEGEPAEIDPDIGERGRGPGGECRVEDGLKPRMPPFEGTQGKDSGHAQAVPESPEQEAASWPMPRPAQHHRDHRRRADPARGRAAAAHLDEHSRPDPFRKCDMPAAPELDEVPTEVRTIEVLGDA